MNIELINNALVAAYNLLYSEQESVCTDDLQEEYSQVLAQLEKAIAETEK